MARPETVSVVPLIEGWLVWDWFVDDAKDAEPDRNDTETGKVGSGPGKTPQKK